jgi:hypothetical protein
LANESPIGKEVSEVELDHLSHHLPEGIYDPPQKGGEPPPLKGGEGALVPESQGFRTRARRQRKTGASKTERDPVHQAKLLRKGVKVLTALQKAAKSLNAPRMSLPSRVDGEKHLQLRRKHQGGAVNLKAVRDVRTDEAAKWYRRMAETIDDQAA